jgi:urease accessory protein
MRRHSFVLLVVCLAAASEAAAHPGHFATATFAFGFEHPWLGLDHMLAAVGVGLWASAQGAGHRWWGPLTFVSSMVVGALIGHSFGAPEMIDTGIAGALVLLGVMLLFADRVPLPAGLGMIAAFAVLHGLAHGSEAPSVGSWPAYLTGLVAGTFVLHVVGVGGGSLVRRSVPRLWPALAVAFALAGGWLLAGG